MKPTIASLKLDSPCINFEETPQIRSWLALCNQEPESNNQLVSYMRNILDPEILKLYPEFSTKDGTLGEGRASEINKAIRLCLDRMEHDTSFQDLCDNTLESLRDYFSEDLRGVEEMLTLRNELRDLIANNNPKETRELAIYFLRRSKGLTYKKIEEKTSVYHSKAKIIVDAWHVYFRRLLKPLKVD